MTATALIIDDEPDIRELIAMTLSRMGLDFHTAANLDEARHLLAEYRFDVCLTDMRLPDGNGVEFVKYIQSTQPELPVAVITAHGNMEAAIDAMKNGAYDFVSKPVDIHQLRRLVVQAVSINTKSANDSDINKQAYRHGALTDAQSNAPATEAFSLPNENGSHSLENLSGRTGQPHPPAQMAGADRLIGSSEPMHELRKMIKKLSRTNAPVWITGESGTGKELIARLIHENSPRAQAPFVAINCGAIPSELMESELFGHKKGSFTGAVTDHDGLFRQADGGTLFLDEVAELPLHMQVKLLRAIQERSIRAVGGNEETSVDVRILSASHKDLNREVDAGRFRHDLYYRLNVICLVAPSLRERIGDIPELSSHILSQIGNTESQSNSEQLTQRALDALAAYHFPGNVRELENLLERAIALCENNIIEVDDLKLPGKSTDINQPNANNNSGLSPHNTASPEKDRILNALHENRWNRKAAAESLGMTYRQLRYRIQQFGFDKP